jgi:hypothetical protein
MRKWTGLVASILFLTMAGCANRIGDFTIVSTKNVEISRVDLKRVDFTRGVEGGNGRWWVLFIPLGPAPNMKEAVDRCLERGHGDFMTSAVIYERNWHVILFGHEAIEVKGDVGNSLSQGAADLPARRLSD